MISSRRLAREWALKILYQTDVGRSPRAEALDTALERLRREFVQKGSRTASGSATEQICLNSVTSALRNSLPTLRRGFEQAVTQVAARLLEEAPYWIELHFEKSFRYYAPGVPLTPPRLLTPFSDARLFAPLLPGTPSLDADLAPEERAQMTAFIATVRDNLPLRLKAEVQLTGRTFAKQLAQNRPLGVAPELLQAFMREAREKRNEELAARWRQVGEIVQKQTGDWLRTAAFTYKLVEGVAARRDEIDTAIEALASGWRLERQVAVDRNILRLAGFEMLFLPGIPTAASINEAVELAKKYSTTESGRFVNGVLGALANRVGDKSESAEALDAIEAGDQDDVLDLPDLSAVEETDDSDEADALDALETDEMPEIEAEGEAKAIRASQAAKAG